MESNGFMIGPGIKEIWAIKVVTSTAGHPVCLWLCPTLLMLWVRHPVLNDENKIRPHSSSYIFCISNAPDCHAHSDVGICHDGCRAREGGWWFLCSGISIFHSVTFKEERRSLLFPAAFRVVAVAVGSDRFSYIWRFSDSWKHCVSDFS